MSTSNPESLIDINVSGLPPTVPRGSLIPSSEFITVEFRNNWDNNLAVKDVRVKTDPRSDHILADGQPEPSNFMRPGESVEFDVNFFAANYGGDAPLNQFFVDPFAGYASGDDRFFFASATGGFDLVVEADFGPQNETWTTSARTAHEIIPNEEVVGLTAVYDEADEELVISGNVTSKASPTQNPRISGHLVIEGHRSDLYAVRGFDAQPRDPGSFELSVPRSEVAGEVGVCVGVVGNEINVDGIETTMDATKFDTSPEMFVPTCVPALVPPPTPDAEFALVDFDPPERVTPGSR